MSFSWLTICAEGQTADCIAPVQLAYLAGVVVAVILLAIVAVRSRDFSTATIALIPVAIAINLAVGSLIYALRLPVYLDSIGTVLVGALAGPWAGALTGILANLLWSVLPIPGGGNPTAAFFAPVAGVIGLMAGFWAARGVFRLRTDDARVGSFLAMFAGIVAAGIAFFVIQATIGIPKIGADATADDQNRFVLIGVVVVAVGVAAAWLTRRTVFAFSGDDPRIRTSLTGATALFAFGIVFALVRLLFAPDGYFSKFDGTDNAPIAGLDLRPWRSRSARPGRRRDPRTARRGGRRCLGTARRQRQVLPGLDRRADDRPGRSGHIRSDRRRCFRWRYRWRDRLPRRAVQDARPRRLPVRVCPGPDERPARQDDLVHGRLPDPRRPPPDRPDDVQPRRRDRRRLTRAPRCRPPAATTGRGRAGSIAGTRSRSCLRSPSSWLPRSCFHRSSCRSSAAIAIVAALSTGLGRDILLTLRVPAALIFSILVVNALFFPGATDRLVSLGPFAITREGLTFGLISAGRLIVAFLTS